MGLIGLMTQIIWENMDCLGFKCGVRCWFILERCGLRNDCERMEIEMELNRNLIIP